jgi:endonuclease-8
VPEGDTIHRVARRFEATLVGREILEAGAPNGRSPLHRRASELAGRTLTSAEAHGKHLLLSFSGDQVVHSHLGMNGRWFVRADGRPSYGKPWLELAAGPAIASQSGGKILRMTSAARARNDPVLLQLGPDPLRPGYDRDAATSRLIAYEPTVAVGEALLDQTLIAGIGNVIRIEACFIAAVSPWRPVGELTTDEATAIVAANSWVMETSLATGHRPKQIYGRARRPCGRCGGRIMTRGQGDDNRVTYWCSGCQR